MPFAIVVVSPPAGAYAWLVIAVAGLTYNAYAPRFVVAFTGAAAGTLAALGYLHVPPDATGLGLLAVGVLLLSAMAITIFGRGQDDLVELKTIIFWCGFFVNAGILFYLYLADVSVPLLGTRFVETPTISGFRAIVHTLLFVTCFYLGFLRKWRHQSA